MASTWLLRLAFLVYPLIIMKLNALIRRKIPEKRKRKEFKRKNEYIIKVVYLITPLLLFHLELMYLDAGFSLSEINLSALIFLFLLQVFLLINAIHSLYRLMAMLRSYNE